MDRQEGQSSELTVENGLNRIPEGSTASPDTVLEWDTPERHWVSSLVIGAVTFAIGAGLLFLFASSARWTMRSGSWMIGTAAMVFTGGFGGLFLLSSFSSWFERGRLVFDKARGTYQVATYVAGLRVKHAVYSLDNVAAVCIKPYSLATTPRKSVSYLLELRKRDEQPVSIRSGLVDETKMESRARAIADFLGVHVEYAKLTPCEAERLCRSEMRFVWAFGGGLLTIFLLLLLGGFTVPLARDALVLGRYGANDVVQVPCRILSFDSHRPRKADGVRRTDGGAELTLTTGTLVDVRFAYEYEGKQYVGTKYAPFSRSASNNVTSYPAGYETVCYLNPKWPDQAVLNTQVRWQAFVFAILATFVVMPLAYIALFFIARSCRPHYQRDLGWPGVLS